MAEQEESRRQLRLIVCRSLFGPILVPENMFQDRRGVYGIIINEGKIVLLRNRSNGGYTFPGGGVESSESDLQAGRREVLEEAGLPVIQLGKWVFRKLLRFAYNPTHTPVFRAYHQDTIVYPMLVQHFDLIPDDQVNDGEAEKPRWVPLDSLGPDSFANPWMWDAFQAAMKKRRHSTSC